MKPEIQEAIKSMEDFHWEEYRYFLVESGPYWTWIILLHIVGTQMRSNIVPISHPPGATEKELMDMTDTLQEQIKKKDSHDLVKTAFPLKNFVFDIEDEIKGGLSEQLRVLEFIKNGLKEIERVGPNLN